MSDAVDGLESMITAVLVRTGYPQCADSVRTIIAEWRLQVGGAELWVGRREQAQRHARVMRMLEEGHSAAVIAKRIGITRQQVYNICKKSSYLG